MKQLAIWSILLLLIANVICIFAVVATALSTVSIQREYLPVEPSVIVTSCPHLLQGLHDQLASVGHNNLRPGTNVLDELYWVAPAFVFALALLGVLCARFLEIPVRPVDGGAEARLRRAEYRTVVVLSTSLVGLVIAIYCLGDVATGGWEYAINLLARTSLVAYCVAAAMAITDYVSRRFALIGSSAVRYSHCITLVAAAYIVGVNWSLGLDLYHDFGQRFIVDLITHPNKTVDKDAIAAAILEPAEGTSAGFVDVVIIAFSAGPCRVPTSGLFASDFAMHKLSDTGYILPQIVAPTFR